MLSCYPKGEVKKERKKKELRGRRSQKGGKTPETLCFLSKKRKGVEAFSLLPQAELRPVQYCAQSALGGRSPVLLWIHSSASGQPSYTVHYCVRLKEEEKKRGGSSGGKENLPLCAGNGKESSCLSELARKSKIFFPQHQFQRASSLVLRDHSCIWVSFSGRQTATPRLLLMMRADVRLVSMNIDVEDSLFHRRTERGKMAAL